MNFKRSTTSMAIALMVLSLISVTSIQQDAFAQKSLGMAITATADKGSDTITVIGKTMSTLTDVTFRVTSPSGNNVVAVWQVTPYDNGEFMVKFIVGPTWTEDGFYEITAMNSVVRNSLYTLNVFVEVNDGITERFSVTDSNLEPGIFELYKGNTVTLDAGLQLDEISYEWGSTMFEVSGITDRVSEAITLTITAPNGNVVSIDQIVAALDGEFMAEINVGGSIWKQDGTYTVTAYQNENPNYTDSQLVEIEAGVVVPEFGTIAAMILAVAIISIIAISAKSRLCVIPRY
jgi:predicted secreted protein with PEFG-CTERM motif